MYDLKIAIPGGFALVRCHSDHLSIYNRSVDAHLNASEIAFMEGHEPVCVHDHLHEMPDMSEPKPKITVIVARITNEYGMPAAVVADSEIFVVNEAGKTVSIHRT